MTGHILSKIKFITFAAIVSFLFFNVACTLAAEVSVKSSNSEVKKGDVFMASIFLSTATGESINAVEGKIIFPSDILSLKKVSDGSTIMNFWTERPHQVNPGEVGFGGLIPGGYQGNKGFIFSIVFQAKKTGRAPIQVQGIRALRNDGLGSEAPVKTLAYTVVISKQIAIQATPMPEVQITDNNAPEVFQPKVVKDPGIFNGKWFLAFATQDKGSGISSFQVKEVRQKLLALITPWTVTESPYVLKDQNLKSFIYVKATDQNGNERVEIILPANPLPWYGYYESWFMAIALLLLGSITYFLWKLTKRRRT